MSSLYPAYEDTFGGDEATFSPSKGQHSLLVAERGTQLTRRLETDASGNLYVHVAAGTIAVTVGEVEISNDTGNPIPVSDAGGSLTVDGTLAVSNFPAVQPVSDNGGSLTVDGPLTDIELRASPVPISATSLPLPAGAATEAKQTQPGVDIGDVTVNNGAGAAAVNVQDGGNALTVDGTVTADQGTPNTIANSWPVKITDGTDTVDVTATSALKVDGSAVTQPISAASLPLPTGAATETELSDKLDGKASSAALSNISGSVSNVTLLSSNSSRKMATIHNDSTSNLFVKFGATASSSSYTVKLGAGDYYEFPIPCYTGQVDGIWSVAIGAARMTEIT